MPKVIIVVRDRKIIGLFKSSDVNTTVLNYQCVTSHQLKDRGKTCENLANEVEGLKEVLLPPDYTSAITHLFPQD